MGESCNSADQRYLLQFVISFCCIRGEIARCGTARVGGGFDDIMIPPTRQKSHIGDVYPSLGRRMSSHW